MADGDVVVRAARIRPGGGERLVDNGFVLVRDGRVIAVEGARVEPPAGAGLVDLGEATLLPGLVDAHVHLAFDEGPDVLTPLLDHDDDTLLATMRRNARRHLERGVTTVRDLGDRRFGSLVLRDEFRAGSVGPELLVAGPPLTRRQGHCWFLGGEADTIPELEAEVDERAARGCDVVKVMATGGVITPGFLPHESQYTVDEIRAVVDRARTHGLPVAAHAHGPQGVRESVAAGVTSVEHCTFFTADGVAAEWEVVEQMARQGTFVGTTSASVPGIDPPPVIKARLEQITENLLRMLDLGVRVVCSSDAGIAPTKPHGVLPHGVVSMVAAGVDAERALAMVTSVAAEACGAGIERAGSRPATTLTCLP